MWDGKVDEGGRDTKGRASERARRRGLFPCHDRWQYQTAIPHNLLRVTRSSYKLAIYMYSGLSFDASSEVFGGQDFALAVGSGKVGGGSSSVWEEGVKRAEPQRERDSGNPSLATADGSIK